MAGWLPETGPWPLSTCGSFSIPSPVGREEKGPVESTFQAPSAPTRCKALQATLSGRSRESRQGAAGEFRSGAPCTAGQSGTTGVRFPGMAGPGPNQAICGILASPLSQEGTVLSPWKINGGMSGSVSHAP